MSYLDTATNIESGAVMDKAVRAAATRRWPEVDRIAISRRGWGSYDDPGEELRDLGFAGCSWSSEHRSLLLLKELNPPDMPPGGFSGLL